jgi:sulfate adenylyltransferase large subunit
MSAANVQPEYQFFPSSGPNVSPEQPLRFTTAGSVDDGKSTLIGRLLYDSQAVYEDQLTSVKKSRINRSTGPIDFSLLTDGLRAEREQGITIDVAYRYFSTPRRKFIIADTPGHEQYTRNMVTGASTADAAIVLIDATKGVLPQSRRHAYIASLLGIRHIVAAVNKMDLVNYDARVFYNVEQEFRELADKLNLADVYAVPISALIGDNVVRRSSTMHWFHGPALLQYLEELPDEDNVAAIGPVRFPIQYVIRPDQAFRGFAGQLESGTLSPGDEVLTFPSGIRTRVKSVVTYDGELDEARAGSAITLTLEDEVDLSRGDLLVSPDSGANVSSALTSMLVWMHSDPLELNKLYILKHNTRTVRALIKAIHHRVDVNTLAQLDAATLHMNDIARVELQTTLPLLFDPYQQIAATGSFILIDPVSNATVAAGMIEGAAYSNDDAKPSRSRLAVTSRERRERFGHQAIVIWVEGDNELAHTIERKLFDRGHDVHLIEPAAFNHAELAAIARAFHASGAITVFSGHEDTDAEKNLRSIFGDTNFLHLERDTNPGIVDNLTHILRLSSRDNEEGQA